MRLSWWHRTIGAGLAFVIVIAIGLTIFRTKQPQIESLLAAYQQTTHYGNLKINYPMDRTVFPSEIVPPTFRWNDTTQGVTQWVISFGLHNDQEPLNFVANQSHWTPSANEWEVIKKRSLEKDLQVTIIGINYRKQDAIRSAGSVTIRTSKDPVGAPIFYREVNLPFVDAVKDPTLIRWRFGPVSSPKPPVVLHGLPVCGNCHSFSREADILAMDIDYANSKGSYIITKTTEEMVLATSDVITWNEYEKEDGVQTFGLLSQISPNGRYVVSTVKDKSVFVPKDDLAFSQLFFPLKGILCIYDRQTQTFNALSGADDPNYVQSNPNWSPDGKYIVFARARAYSLKHTEGEGTLLLTRKECREFLEDGKLFPFDLYRIPFNEGKGGEPEPLEGASNNGMSNYFAKYSPNGKWIVFCRAKSFMLLQPDSKLYIIPSQGGQARQMQCNTDLMNSWHSWSPNGKWLVFTSKAYSPYTQLMLTHIDEQGCSTPSVLLAHFTEADRAANIPEFVNASPTAIRKIREQFLDDYSFVRAGNEFFKTGETDRAIEEYNNALALNPNNVTAHLQLGFLFYNVKSMYEKGFAHYLKAAQLDPENPRVHYNIGMALIHQQRFDQAISHLSEALRRMPYSISLQYDLGNLHLNLGIAFLHSGKPHEAQYHFIKAIDIHPDNAKSYYNLAMAFASQGHTERACQCYKKSVSLQASIDTSPILHCSLASSYAEKRQFKQAIACAEKALELAKAAKDTELCQSIAESLKLYHQVNKSLQ